MDKNHRLFQLDTEWSAIHVPERPNGFGVFIIGDKNSFVDESTSFWIQNQGRNQFIHYLQNEGYTVFYSNLYGTNWGSPDAIKLAVLLCHIVMKSEILNNRIHIFAEGMGALIAQQMLHFMEDKIRTIAFLNPCLDLLGHIEHEKKNKLFYKRLVKELSISYKINEKEVVKHFEKYAPITNLHTAKVPIKIWQSTTEKTYHPEIHSRKYQNGNRHITLSYHLAEKAFAFSQSVSQFFQENEDIL